MVKEKEEKNDILERHG